MSLRWLCIEFVHSLYLRIYLDFPHLQKVPRPAYPLISVDSANCGPANLGISHSLRLDAHHGFSFMALYSGLPTMAPRAHGGASKATRVALVAVMCACACLGMLITHYSAQHNVALVEEADGLELNAYLSESQNKQFKKLIALQVSISQKKISMLCQEKNSTITFCSVCVAATVFERSLNVCSNHSQ
jgi:hypothetical protein